MVEAGYLMGSLLFTAGTMFFFPVEGLEDFVVGCRFYEAGSVLFAALTLYSEIDRWHARKTGEEHGVTKRDLLEQLLYCIGSFVFLLGTFLFDPPCVSALSSLFAVPKSNFENAAALLFMVGSFMFSLGAYVNALSIFEAPRMFRKHLVIVTSSYMFGGLLFIAGTMGYVEAFEPNLELRWCATWFYLVGCLFYVAGSFLSFVNIVARHQVRWERVQDEEHKKKKTRLGRAASALPRALKSSKWKRKQQRAGQRDDPAMPERQNGISLDSLDSLEETGDESTIEDLDLEELVAALTIGDGLREEEDVFGAFWRSVTGAGAVMNDPAGRVHGDDAAGAAASAFTPAGQVIGIAQRDNLGLLRAQGG